MSRRSFARGSSKRGKASRGATGVEDTPISIRASVPLTDRFEQRARTQLARRIGHAGRLIERGTIRFEDVNGPRGGVDIICRIKLVVSGEPSVIVEKRADTPEHAYAAARHAIGTTVARNLTRRGHKPRATAARMHRPAARHARRRARAS